MKGELSDSKLRYSTSSTLTENKPTSTKSNIEPTTLPTPTARTKSDFQEGDKFFSKVVGIPGKGEAEKPKTASIGESPMPKNNNEATDKETMEFDKKAFHDGVEEIDEQTNRDLGATNHREDDEVAKSNSNEDTELGKQFKGSDSNTGLEDIEKDQAEEKNKSVATSDQNLQSKSPQAEENDIDTKGAAHLSDAKNKIVYDNVSAENNKQTDKDASISKNLDAE